VVGKPEGKRQLGKPRRRREGVTGKQGNSAWDNGFVSADLGHRPVAYSCEHGTEPSGSIQGVEQS
jgi:hypothetical protein